MPSVASVATEFVMEIFARSLREPE